MSAKKRPSKAEVADKKPAMTRADELGPDSLDKVTGGGTTGVAPRGPSAPGG